MKTIIRSIALSSLIVGLLILSTIESISDSSTFSSSKLRELVDESTIIFPDSQDVQSLSQLAVQILSIDSSNPPEEVIPSKYKIHSWIEAKFSTEVLVVTQHPEANIFDIPSGNQIPGKLIIMFRGSEALDDWLANINVAMDEANFEGAPDDVKVHRGYQNALFQDDIPTRIEDTIFTLFNDTSLNLQPNAITLSGHSQGGALSHMMGIYLADKYEDFNIEVMTFGEPRFGNKALKSWVKTSLPNLIAWRFVYRRDFAPRSIPRFLGYAHTGHLYYFNNFTSSVYYDQTGGERKYVGAPNSWYGDVLFDEWEHNAYSYFLTENVDNADFWSHDFERCERWQCWFV